MGESSSPLFVKQGDRTVMNCHQCKKTISGGHVTADGMHFHLECFVCGACGKQILNRYCRDGALLYHEECMEKDRLLCAHCHKVLDGRYIESSGKKYHPSCYEAHVQPHCLVCGKKISGKYTFDDDGSYHVDCFRNSILPKCDVCRLPLEEGYIIDGWGNKSHRQHDGSAVHFCASCSRIISERTTGSGVRYRDGRTVCNLCRKEAVDSISDIGTSFKDVYSILTQVGFSGIPNPVEVFVINAEKLKDKLSRLKYDHKKRS